ncbi:hypothetical protein C7402_11993 [Paraburkholderia unamae]|uniref:Methyltransferase family protein n=2 Tax=Paraburkholderia unamae TaxID=219649 RepID=A0ABX5KDA0_9BURK|nr:hypothetical protein C7402_11993 [Paraburkholderia unamae]CAG9245152.1 conserved hypothetical protein [Paraburkholderia unamae]
MLPAMSPSRIHLCILQPEGMIHALCFLDHARYFRYQFRRLGAEVSIGKNRLRHDAINFVFGAHGGFDPTLKERFRCVFVNLEQLGAGGAQVSPEYLQLLASSEVVDYDASNVLAYRSEGAVPIVSFAHAPYLEANLAPALESRPVDILFFGSINERRRRMLLEIQAAGCNVRTLPFGVYGPERDSEIQRAKAVFNCHYYESARFEQARVFQCLSLGTPVISERTATTSSPAQFDDSVFWVGGDQIRTFFETEFRAPGFADEARNRLGAFAMHDVLDQYETALDSARKYFGHQNILATPWRPEKLHVGSGRHYLPGYLNIDILPRAEPDTLLDLCKPLELPARLACTTVGPVELMPASVELIYANNVLEHVGDLPQLMTNCLNLLKESGHMLIEVPYEKAPGAWQDPTHVRAFNENSWIYYTDWFWYLGWFESRFAVVHFEYLDGKLAGTTREHAHFMRVRLQKIATTAVERAKARATRADFGGLPEDDLPGAGV